MPSAFLSNKIQALRESENILCICGVNIGFHVGKKNLSYLEDFSYPLLAFFFSFVKKTISRNPQWKVLWAAVQWIYLP